MSRMFTAREFLDALAAGGLERTIVRTGMVKVSESETESLLFSEGSGCEDWVKLPLTMIQMVEYLDSVPCKDHQHPRVNLYVVVPPSADETVTALGKLLRSAVQKPVQTTFKDSSTSGTASGPNSPQPGAGTRHNVQAPDLDLPPHSVLMSRRPERAASATSIPAAIASILGEEFSINCLQGGAQCVAAVAGILDHYETCVSNGGDAQGCARSAARQIRDYACRSYCNCSNTPCS